MTERFAMLDKTHRLRFTDDILEWGRWLEGAERRVARNKVGDVDVSTVFLGLDHGFGGSPLWFETMVFGGPLDGEQDRYTTWEQAESGHAAMVSRALAASGTPTQENDDG